MSYYEGYDGEDDPGNADEERETDSDQECEAVGLIAPVRAEVRELREQIDDARHRMDMARLGGDHDELNYQSSRLANLQDELTWYGKGPQKNGSKPRGETRTGKPKKTGLKASRYKRKFTLLNEFDAKHKQHLPLVVRDVWYSLFRDERDGLVDTAMTDLARRSGVCTKTIQRAVALLTERGYLVTVRPGSLRNGPTVRRMVLPDLEGQEGQEEEV